MERFISACGLCVGWLAWAVPPAARGADVGAVAGLPVDADGDGVSTWGDRYVLSWWLEETGESLEAVLAQGQISGDVIDLSGYFAPRMRGGTGSGAAPAAVAAGGGGAPEGGSSRVIRRYPVMYDGTEPDGPSEHARVTPGGMFFVFASKATKVVLLENPVPFETFQVYRARRLGGGGVKQEIASLDASGHPASQDQDCLHPSISDDGSVVVFDTTAPLVSGDNTGKRDVYARQFTGSPGAGTTELVSQTSTGTGPANGDSEMASISGDGRFVAFTSKATDIDSQVFLNPVYTHVFRVERGVGGSGLHVSKDEGGNPVDGAATADPQLNAVGRVMPQDGAMVTYQGKAPGANVIHCWVNDLSSSQVSALSRYLGALGNGDSRNPCFATRDLYRRIAFTSKATNLAPNDGPVEDVFLDEVPLSPGGLENLTLPLGANGHSTRVMLTTDAEWLTFTSAATNLVAGDPDTNGARDVFLADLNLGTLTLDSVDRVKAADGSEGDAHSETSDVSDGGHVVVFESDATNLLGPGVDQNGFRDIFEWSETDVHRTFRRGDANDDASVDLSDSVFILNWLFRSGPQPDCLDSADCDDSGDIVLTDPVYLQNYLFRGGAPPPPPGPDACGPDPTQDALTCEISICEP